MAPVVGRIRRRASFRALARPEGRASRGPLTVAYRSTLPDELAGAPLIAYAVGRRMGSAVDRNRLRRRLRAAARSCAGGLPPGGYLVRVDPGAASLPFSSLCDALGGAAAAAAARTAGARTAGAGRGDRA